MRRRLCVGGFTAAVRAERSFELAAEAAVASDILILQSSAVAKGQRGAAQFNFSVAGNAYDIDYRPVAFDFQGRPATLRRHTFSAQASVRQPASRTLTLLGGAGLYDGFTNYRSIWLDEYNRQQYAALTFFRNYREARPQGVNASVGLRWEYLQATGFAQVNLSWLSDRVAPGYEIDFEGLRRGSDTLNTAALEAVFENIVTARLRTLQPCGPVRPPDAKCDWAPRSPRITRSATVGRCAAPSAVRASGRPSPRVSPD